MLSKNMQKLTYNLFFKRTWTYVIFVITGAYCVEEIINTGVDKWWDHKNKGKLFKDMVVDYKKRGIIKE
jgi:hypothetical protein